MNIINVWILLEPLIYIECIATEIPAGLLYQSTYKFEGSKIRWIHWPEKFSLTIRRSWLCSVLAYISGRPHAAVFHLWSSKCTFSHHHRVKSSVSSHLYQSLVQDWAQKYLQYTTERSFQSCPLLPVIDVSIKNSMSLAKKKCNQHKQAYETSSQKVDMVYTKGVKWYCMYNTKCIWRTVVYV